MRSAKQLSHTTLSLLPSNYIYHLRPITSLLAASASDSTIRLISPGPTVLALQTTITTPHPIITSLASHPTLPLLFSGGSDGTITAWDPRSPSSPSLTHSNSSLGPITSISLSSTPSPLLAVGTEYTNHQSVVSIYDARQPNSPVVLRVDEAHNDDITVLQWSEVEGGDRYVMSGGMDGLVSVLDVREKEPDEALVKVANLESSVAHAGWFAEGTGMGMGEEAWFGVSHDERLMIWNVPVREGSEERRYRDEEEEGEGDDVVVDFGDVRERLDCEYVIGVKEVGGEMVMAVGKHSERRVELLPLRREWKEGEGLEEARGDAIRLEGGHGMEIVRDFYAEQGSRVVFTGGEDGEVKCWEIQGDEEGNRGGEGEVKTGPVRGKGRKEGGKANLFKPY